MLRATRRTPLLPASVNAIDAQLANRQLSMCCSSRAPTLAERYRNDCVIVTTNMIGTLKQSIQSMIQYLLGIKHADIHTKTTEAGLGYQAVRS